MKNYKGETTMLRIIWIGIQCYINQDEEGELPQGDDVTKEEYNVLKIAYNKQNIIGWKHFLCGRVSKAWKDYYSLRIPNSKEKVGKVLAFGKSLVMSAWMYTLNVWKAHNKAVHGAKGKYSERDTESIKNCIKEIYDMEERVSTEDGWLFREGVRVRQGKPVPQMIGWLERVLLCLTQTIIYLR